MTDDGVHKVWCRERESEKEMRVNCLVIEFRGFGDMIAVNL